MDVLQGKGFRAHWSEPPGKRFNATDAARQKEKARKYRAFTRGLTTQNRSTQDRRNRYEGMCNTIKLTTAINGARTSGVTRFTVAASGSGCRNPPPSALLLSQQRVTTV